MKSHYYELLIVQIIFVALIVAFYLWNRRDKLLLFGIVLRKSSNAGSVRMGETVKLRGTVVVSDKCLESPIKGCGCVSYHTEIAQGIADIANKFPIEPLALVDIKEATTFTITDDTGRIVVPIGSDIMVGSDIRYTSGKLAPNPGQLEHLAESVGISVPDIDGDQATKRSSDETTEPKPARKPRDFLMYRERCLQPGEKVAVMGVINKNKEFDVGRGVLVTNWFPALLW
jgi:hypothetical protein